MKKKVMIISNTVGVIYKFKFELLEELLKENYEVYLFAQNEAEDSYLEEIKKIGVNYTEIKLSRRGLNPLKDFKVFLDYYKKIKKIKPNFIYTFTIKPNLYGGLLARSLNIKYAATITGLGTAFQKNTLISKVLKIFYKESLKNSKGVFFENSTNLDFFIKNKMIKKEKSILIPGSGVNLKKFYPMNRNRKDNRIVFLFIGRIMKEKGIEEFLETAKKIKEKYKETEFWILGNYEEEKYKKLIEELQKRQIIRYLGVKNDVRKVLKEIDFLIQPSYHEGMSNVILEASAMKKLVLASNIAGCREGIYNKKYLFEIKNIESLKEKVIMCIENFENLEEDRNKQREFIIEKFNRVNIILKNIKILKK